MLPDRVSNPGPLTYESGALPIALRGPAQLLLERVIFSRLISSLFTGACVTVFENERPENRYTKRRILN